MCGPAFSVIMLIGPCILPFHLNGMRYSNFVDYVLPELLEDVLLNVRQRMYFQLDGALAHFSIAVRNHLRDTFGNRWIDRGGRVLVTQVTWPHVSGFLLLGHMKHCCMKPLWKQKKTSSLELPSLLVPLRTCQESSNGHNNQCSDNVLRAYRPMVTNSSSSCEYHWCN